MLFYLLHPQALLMATNKSLKMYPEAIRNVMSANFAVCYRRVIGVREGNEFQFIFMDVFGGKWVESRIELGVLNQFAKFLANTLDLPDTSSVLEKGEKAVFDSHVEIH